MSKNIVLQNLINELESLPEVIDDSILEENKSIILTRYINGVSSEKWQTALKGTRLKHWYAIPVKNGIEEWNDSLVVDENRKVAITPFRELKGVIAKGMFLKLLEQELARIVRTGGNLSIISCGITDADNIVYILGESMLARLEALLASIMLENLESCDSVGILRNGQFLCSLPGLGQLASRNYAEKIRVSFNAQAQALINDAHKNYSEEINCSIGIVNLLQGDSCNVQQLVKRSSAALEMALARGDSHIYQESTLAPLENTTLVQSSEKRFLFFGE